MRDPDAMHNLRPLAPFKIRDLNREIEERLNQLTPMKTLVIVKSFKKGKCYGIGFSIPEKDLILRNFARIWQTVMPPNATASPTVALLDIGGVSRNVRAHIANCWDVLSNQGSQLGFGNPAAAPTPARADYEIASPVALFNPSVVTLDETLWLFTVTGSYVWAAGGTVRCAGQYQTIYDSGGAARTVLFYYDAVSDVVVPAGGTVSVTYSTQF